MADSYTQVPANGAGNKHQTYSNSVSGNTVHAGAMVLVNSAGTPLDAVSGTAVPMVGNIADNGVDAGPPVKVGGKYNASTQTYADGDRADLQTDVNGNLKTTSFNGDATIATYMVSAYISFSGACDEFFNLKGSASKTVRVRSIRFNCYTSGSAAALILQLVKRSTANSGGTSTAKTSVPLDSSDAAATAVALAYTVTPTTLGTSVGAIAARAYQILASSVAGNCVEVEWKFGEGNSKPLKLSGTAQSIGIGFASTPTLGATVEMGVTVVYTEE